MFKIYEMLKPPLQYQGSKQKEVKIIDEYLPECKKLIDAFGGGGSVSLYFKQKYPDMIVNYNDISKNMCELMNVLKDEDKAKKLIDDYNKIVYTREDHKQRHKSIVEACKENKHDLLNFVFLSCVGFRGQVFTSTPNIRNGVVSRKKLDHFVKYAKLMREIEVTNEDALCLIEKNKDDEDTFIYLDPPYLQHGTNNVNYNMSMTTEILKKLFDYVKSDLKCKIMLHIDFSGWVCAEMKDYIIHYYPAKYNMSKKDGVNYHKRYICIITNYKL